MAGYLTDVAGPLYPNGFPSDMVAVLEQAFGRKIVGNRRASGTAMLRECEAEHLSSGALIVWTDGRRTCHVAAHEKRHASGQILSALPGREKITQGPLGILRVSAHPLLGDAGAVQFSPQPRAFVLEPPGPTMFDVLNRASQILVGVGKVGDLFSGRGLTRSVPVGHWTALLAEVTGMLKRFPED